MRPRCKRIGCAAASSGTRLPLRTLSHGVCVLHLVGLACLGLGVPPCGHSPRWGADRAMRSMRRCCCRGQERFARTRRCPPSTLASHRAQKKLAGEGFSPLCTVRTGRFEAPASARRDWVTNGARKKKILGLSFLNALVRGGAAEIPSEVELVFKSFLISTTGFTKINNLPFLRKEQYIGQKNGKPAVGIEPATQRTLVEDVATQP